MWLIFSDELSISGSSLRCMVRLIIRLNHLVSWLVSNLERTDFDFTVLNSVGVACLPRSEIDLEIYVVPNESNERFF